MVRKPKIETKGLIEIWATSCYVASNTNVTKKKHNRDVFELNKLLRLSVMRKKKQF